MALETFVPISSNIDRASYESETQVLRITFKEGNEYEYSSVPQSVWDGLKNAPSAGQYFYRQIRDRFSYTQV